VWLCFVVVWLVCVLFSGVVLFVGSMIVVLVFVSPLFIRFL